MTSPLVFDSNINVGGEESSYWSFDRTKKESNKNCTADNNSFKTDIASTKLKNSNDTSDQIGNHHKENIIIDQSNPNLELSNHNINCQNQAKYLHSMLLMAVMGANNSNSFNQISPMVSMNLGSVFPFAPPSNTGLVDLEQFSAHLSPSLPPIDPLIMMKMIMGTNSTSETSESSIFQSNKSSEDENNKNLARSDQITTLPNIDLSSEILSEDKISSPEISIKRRLRNQTKNQQTRSSLNSTKRRSYSSNRHLVLSSLSSSIDTTQNFDKNNHDDSRLDNPIYRCHLCSYTGNSKMHFNAHMNTHFDHRCPHCDYTSRTEGRLKRHIRDFHSETPPETWTGAGTKLEDESILLEAAELIEGDGEMSAGGNGPNPARNRKYRCKQCGYVALDKHDFWEHSKDHIKLDKMLACPKCNFVTEYKHHLEYHLRNHFGSKPFKCGKCNYSCVNKSMLNSHMKSHSNIYQYRCEDCTYATKYCHSLKLHLRKYKHRPATVLNLDGTPNPFPVIDVYGTRRGPRPKKHSLIHKSSLMETETEKKTSKNKMMKKNLETKLPDKDEKTEQLVCESFNQSTKESEDSEETNCSTSLPLINLRCNYCSFQTESKPEFSNHLLNHVMDEKLTLLNRRKKEFKRIESIKENDDEENNEENNEENRISVVEQQINEDCEMNPPQSEESIKSSLSDWLQDFLRQKSSHLDCEKIDPPTNVEDISLKIMERKFHPNSKNYEISDVVSCETYKNIDSNRILLTNRFEDKIDDYQMIENNLANASQNDRKNIPHTESETKTFEYCENNSLSVQDEIMNRNSERCSNSNPNSAITFSQSIKLDQIDMKNQENKSLSLKQTNECSNFDNAYNSSEDSINSNSNYLLQTLWQILQKQSQQQFGSSSSMIQENQINLCNRKIESSVLTSRLPPSTQPPPPPSSSSASASPLSTPPAVSSPILFNSIATNTLNNNILMQNLNQTSTAPENVSNLINKMNSITYLIQEILLEILSIKK